MAVCARGSVHMYLFFMRYLPGVFFNFFFGGGGDMDRAVFQGRARMITN